MNKDDSKLFQLKLIKKMYKKDIYTILEKNKLDFEVLDGKPFILSKNTLPFNKNTMVVGGACIDRCDGNIFLLSINFYMDVLMPINYAMKYGIDCCIYVDTPIEVFSNSREEIEKWIKLVGQIEIFVKNMSKFLGINIYVIRRDVGYKLLNDIIGKYNFIDDKNLVGLYDLNPSAKEYLSDNLKLHFKRTIASYLPKYLSSYLNMNINNVIIVEELSQCKAINQAMNISGHIQASIYLDMPSASCKNRMHRSRNKIKIFEEIKKDDLDPMFKIFIDGIDLYFVYKKFKVKDFISLKNKLKEVWNY